MGKDDRFLHEKAREALRTGKFPHRAPDQVWGGPGTGAECAVCGGATRHAEVELEIEFSCAQPGGSASYLVHLRCYSILELERQAARSPAAKPQQTQAAAPSFLSRGLERPNGG
jgi:hypothetical protein